MPTGAELKAMAGGGARAPSGADLKALVPENFAPIPDVITPERAERGGGIGRMGAEIAGGALGTAAGAPLGIPGMMAGGGLGTAAGGQVHDLMTGRAADRSLPEQFLDVGRDVLHGAPSAGAGGFTGRVAENVARGRARGGRDITTALIDRGKRLEDQARLGADPDTSNAARKIVRQFRNQLFGAGAAGAGGAFALGDPVAGAGAGAATFIITALRKTPEVTQDLLANNPRFARWALSTGASRPVAAAGGGAGVALEESTGAVSGGAAEAVGKLGELLDLFAESSGEERQAIKQFTDQLALEVRDMIGRGEQ